MSRKITYLLVVFIFLISSLLTAQADESQEFIIYNATSLQRKGGIEVKVFNNLFSADYQNLDSKYRSNYFSSFVQTLYGVGNFDVGFDVVLKSNLVNDYDLQSPLQAVHFSMFSEQRQIGNSDITTSANSGLAHIGPKIKFIPFKKIPALAFQQTLYIPVVKAVDGKFIWASQFFYNRPITPKQQLFVEATIWQPIGETWNFPFVKGFYSYFPNPRWTIYGTTTLLLEWGAGMKYQLLPGVEAELLYTRYLPIDPVINRVGDARTFNLGFRWTR